jgi:electron transfer flavoprotein alpha subunit
MDKILFLAHPDDSGKLSRTSLEALSAARNLADGLSADLEVALFGGDVQVAADSIAACGASAFLGAAGNELKNPCYFSDAAAAEALCRKSGAEMIVAPATSRIARIAAGVAERLGGRADAAATGAAVKDDGPHISRWLYRQRMVADVTREQRPWLVTVAPCCFIAWEGESGSADVAEVSVDYGDKKGAAEHEGMDVPKESSQTIRPDSDLLFVAGAGWSKKQPDGDAHADEAEKLILGFVDKAKASLGSSKSLVDVSSEGGEVLSFMTHLHQVGQTGSTPRHPKGLATCCHGEEPHVVGWRFITERRAVNLDAGCGWAQGKADVLYVADAFEVMRKVNELLGA